MSDNTQTPPSTAELLPPVVADVLPDIGLEEPIKISWLPSGQALVVADRKDIIEAVRAQYGLNVFYLACDKKKTETWVGKHIQGHWVPPGSQDVYTPTIFKVVFNTIGWSVHEAPPQPSGLAPMETSAMFTLPQIPIEIIYRLDAFFRTVADELKTEAIVILTFDPTVDGPNSSQGWGVSVPTQTNTPGHCDYAPESIVAGMPDNAVIVGTAHSHPGMSAFASGTDHHDQADFDGIHITFGWQSTVNQGATQFHLELQMGGKPWTLKAEDVFTEAPKPPTFPEVNEWKKNVTKRPSGGNTSVTPASRPRMHQPPDHVIEGMTPGQGYDKVGQGFILGQNKWAEDHTAPTEAPDPKYFIVICELLDDQATQCPMCLSEFQGSKERDRRRCSNCWNWLSLPGETLEDIAKVRIDASLDFFDIDPERQKDKPIKFWKRWRDGDEVKVRIDDVVAPGAPGALAGGEIPAPLAPIPDGTPELPPV